MSEERPLSKSLAISGSRLLLARNFAERGASNGQEKLVTTADESVARRELEKRAKAEGRLPPGQSVTLKWPILHYGSVPRFEPEKWDFKISGGVETPVKLNWKEFGSLPKTEVTSDFHCVTRW